MYLQDCRVRLLLIFNLARRERRFAQEADLVTVRFRRVMIDCSRNGVLNVKSVKWLLRQMAMMGSNMLQVSSVSLLSFLCEHLAHLEQHALSCTVRTHTRSKESLSSVGRIRPNSVSTRSRS